jgi:beta-lactamase superfamily II metal-dependent hydrolase
MKSFPDRKEDFSMWQLNAFDQHVQMGYIIRTDNGKIVVIDGGGIEQAHYLERILKMLGGNVDSWIITHPHYDHSGAFLKLIESNSINIKRLYHSELNNSWVNMVEPDFANKHRRYKEIVASSNIPVEDLTAGEELMLDMGVKLICLGAKNEDIKENAVNNSSLVFKIVSLKKSILFLGDLGVKGGEKLLKSIKKDEIKADYVQMAHHGQHGVDENVYKAISPNYALWPTPSWLWFNDNGNGGNSGNWKTLEVRKWMQALNIKENYVSGLDGTIQID